LKEFTMSKLEGFDQNVIQKAYDDFGFKCSWTFLCCPQARIKTARVAIVGLNPGGCDDEGHYKPSWEFSENVYFHEHWGSGVNFNPLQIQIQQWHVLAKVAASETLCAQYVPFRSRDWKGLANQKKVLEFSKRLWAWLVDTTSVLTFITMGSVAGDGIADLLGCGEAELLPTGWGNVKIRVRKSPSGCRVIIMPHPSRYGLFLRGNGASQIAEESFQKALTC
jgi:hypothetical protein